MNKNKAKKNREDEDRGRRNIKRRRLHGSRVTNVERKEVETLKEDKGRDSL